MNYGKGKKETFCLGASATSSVLQSHSPCFLSFMIGCLLVIAETNQINGMRMVPVSQAEQV